MTSDTRLLPLRRLFRVVNGSTPASGEPSYWDGDIVWVTPEDLGKNVGQTIASSRRQITREGYSTCGTALVPAGSILVSSRAPIGHTAIAGVALCTNQGCKSLVATRPGDPRFFCYQLSARTADLQALGQGSTFTELSADKLAAFPVMAPPLREQQRIADFLDRKTAVIDEVVAKKERLVALLAEKRQALITQLVTKGLDPTVPMRDSGVNWLGSVPAHWDVKMLRRDTLVKRGASPRPIDDPKYFDEGGRYAWVRISDVTASDATLLSTEQRLSDLGASLSVKLLPGQLFLSIAGSVGKACVAGIDCCIHDGFVYFPTLSALPRFLQYVFFSGEAFRGLGKLGTQLNLNTDIVGAIALPFPPPDEQAAIVRQADKICGGINTAAKAIARSLDRLREYRQALITAAVTGQLDVTDARAVAAHDGRVDAALSEGP